MTPTTEATDTLSVSSNSPNHHRDGYVKFQVDSHQYYNYHRIPLVEIPLETKTKPARPLIPNSIAADEIKLKAQYDPDEFKTIPQSDSVVWKRNEDFPVYSDVEYLICPHEFTVPIATLF